jgi:hypothetical protein
MHHPPSIFPNLSVKNTCNTKELSVDCANLFLGKTIGVTNYASALLVAAIN